MGTFRIGSISLGTSFVAGKNLVPLPATGMIALVIFILRSLFPLFEFKLKLIGIMRFLSNLIKPLRFINIVFLLSLFTTAADAKLRPLETTRLMSTSGAGIGSLLLNEAAFLNPASVYFFKSSSFYYQRGSSQLDNESKDREGSIAEGKNEVFLLTDTSSPLKGGFSYQTQSFNGWKRKRLTSSASTNVGERASFGLLYRYTEEDLGESDIYHQVVFGASYVHDEKLTLGATLVDPFQSNPGDTHVGLGAQYSLFQNLQAIADIGTDYRKSLEKGYFWAAALQAQFFGNFFLRHGRNHNSNLESRASSWGLSWV